MTPSEFVINFSTVVHYNWCVYYVHYFSSLFQTVYWLLFIMHWLYYLISVFILKFVWTISIVSLCIIDTFYYYYTLYKGMYDGLMITTIITHIKIIHSSFSELSCGALASQRSMWTCVHEHVILQEHLHLVTMTCSRRSILNSNMRVSGLYMRMRTSSDLYSIPEQQGCTEVAGLPSKNRRSCDLPELPRPANSGQYPSQKLVVKLSGYLMNLMPRSSSKLML